MNLIRFLAITACAVLSAAAVCIALCSFASSSSAENNWYLPSRVVAVYPCAEVGSAALSCTALGLANGSIEEVEVRVTPALLASGDASAFATTTRGFGHVCAIGAVAGPCRLAWTVGMAMLDTDPTTRSRLVAEINRVTDSP